MGYQSHQAGERSVLLGRLSLRNARLSPRLDPENERNSPEGHCVWFWRADKERVTTMVTLDALIENVALEHPGSRSCRGTFKTTHSRSASDRRRARICSTESPALAESRSGDRSARAAAEEAIRSHHVSICSLG